MSKKKVPIADRVAQAAATAVYRQHYVCAIDVLVGIGWLDQDALERWRRRQVSCLERVVRSNLPRITEAMKCMRKWARENGLVASKTVYLSYKPRRPLRFSSSGQAAIEQAYRTHWVSPRMRDEKLKQRAQKASAVPEQKANAPARSQCICLDCGGRDFLAMKHCGLVCLRCAGFADLELVPAYDAL